MKNNLLFIIPLLAVAVALFMLQATGMIAHIILAALGLIVLIAYTIVTKKEWVNPVLEIIFRICYGIALITGVILMNVHGIEAVTVIHKISAALFIIIMVILEIQKQYIKNNAN